MSPGDTWPSSRPRPSLHFTASRGWINDPHGVTFRDGRYHLFYQAVPDAPRWQPGISWGHATSRDLLTWEQQPAALVPGDGDDGCWSGSVCTTPAEAPPILYYTSVTVSNLDHGTVRAARPVDDDWTVWRKGRRLVSTPAEPPVVVFRDPNVFWDAGCWRMLVGAGYADGRAAVLCYRSPDQEHWTYEGPLAESPGQVSRRARHSAWECPQLIRVADRHVLLVSAAADGTPLDAAVAVGSYHAGRMQIDHWSQLTYGPGHYAPSTFLDADGHPCVIFWIRDIADASSGWSGAMSIPYRLTLVDDRLALDPHPALAAARPDRRQTVGFTWHPVGGKSSQLSLRSNGGQPALDLLTDGSTLMVATPLDTVTAPTKGEDVHVLIDNGVLEIATRHGVVGLPAPIIPDLIPTPGTVTLWWH